MKKAIAILLSPLSFLFWSVTALRNHLFNINYSRSFQFDKPVIVVGNLEVGGTGKTPMIEYLVRLLQPFYHVATLSRGYGRKTKGCIIADDLQNAKTLGDEPYQYYLKYGHKITVAVGEERAWAIPQILLEKPETQVFLLDDAFQHRKVKGDLNILLTRYHRPFYHDFPLPSGRLREWRSGAARADAVIVSKCPAGVEQTTMQEMENRIKRYAPQAPVYFTTIKYESPAPVFNQQTFEGKNVILFTGLAHTWDLEQYLQQQFHLVESLHFPDHHDYQEKDFQKIKNIYQKHRKQKPVLLTTEKDMVKIKATSDFQFKSLPVFYQPITIKFLKNGKNFDSLVENSILSKL